MYLVLNHILSFVFQFHPFTFDFYIRFYPHSFNCNAFSPGSFIEFFFSISLIDIWFLYQIWFSFFWLFFLVFLILLLIEIIFQFHPLWFDFIFLYPIWFSFFSNLYFFFFILFLFYFSSVSLIILVSLEFYKVIFSGLPLYHDLALWFVSQVLKVGPSWLWSFFFLFHSSLLD
jgi:hypothetical protein